MPRTPIPEPYKPENQQFTDTGNSAQLGTLKPLAPNLVTPKPETRKPCSLNLTPKFQNKDL